MGGLDLGGWMDGWMQGLRSSGEVTRKNQDEEGVEKTERDKEVESAEREERSSA